jgi:hypothetical protein
VTAPPNPDYPVRLEIDYVERPSRLSTFLRGLLVIPHLIVLTFVGIASLFAILAAWVAVLFTGRFPRGLFDFIVGVIRWGARVTAYMFLMTDRYPPFALVDDPGYPVRLEIDYPEQIENWRPLVNWLLVIPFGYAASGLLFAAYFVVMVAWFAIVFTGRYPEGMFDFVTIPLRWSARHTAYFYFMVERYPPFEWA